MRINILNQGKWCYHRPSIPPYSLTGCGQGTGKNRFSLKISTFYKFYRWSTGTKERGRVGSIHWNYLLSRCPYHIRGPAAMRNLGLASSSPHHVITVTIYYLTLAHCMGIYFVLQTKENKHRRPFRVYGAWGWAAHRTSVHPRAQPVRMALNVN